MNLHRALPRVLGCLFALLAAAGCATTGRRDKASLPEKPVTVAGMTAYAAGTNIEIVFPQRGKDTFAHASWDPARGEAPDYQYHFAALTFEKQERAARRVVVKKENRIAVGDAKQWQRLVQGVFQELTPAQSGHGIALVAQNRELVIYRETGGKPKAVKLESKPAEVKVDATLSDREFSQRLIQLIEKQKDRHHDQDQLLFLTGEDPAFVLIDLRQKMVLFLGYPPDPETRPLEEPGWFAIKALHSLVFKSHILTAIKNPFTLVARGVWHIGNSGAAAIQSGTQSATEPPPLYTGPGMDLAAWEKELDGLVSARRYQGKVDFFIDGETFFPALIQSIQNATRTVDVLVFIFDVDDYAVEIAKLLKARSSQVRVRVLMDEMGSLFAAEVPPQTGPPDFKPPSDIRFYLKSRSHVQVRAAANPWLTADHRKCIIVDGRQAYVGGMNIGREYRYEWHDLMVGLTGPVVGRLDKDYREAWAHAGLLGDFAYAWEWMFTRVNARKMEVPDAIDIRPLRTATFNVGIYHAQLAAIQRAKRYIYIENAYFDDDTILRELIRARRRGVDVRVILPGANDSGIMQTSNQIMANELLKNGIRVYAYPRMTHVKAAIYDGWACLGSANFEKMSLRVSQELDVAFSDKTAVNRLKQELFEKDFEASREQKTPVPLSWMDFVMKAFADQL